MHPLVEFALTWVFICVVWVRLDLLAFSADICGPVMCAVSRYSKELASYWVMVGDFQQKFEFDLGELLGDRIRAGRNSWKPADQKGSKFHVMNSVGVVA